MCTALATVTSGGLATLDESAILVLRHLDHAILTWGKAQECRQVEFPAVSPVADLERIDYFHNFPHLGLAVSPIRSSALAQIAQSRESGSEGRIASDLLEPAAYFLPSAACYPVYAQLQNQLLGDQVRRTTSQRCFRNEAHYDGLARLRCFTMRELICVGAAEAVQSFLSTQRAWIDEFARGCGIGVSIRPATDPFFEQNGPRARMQQMFPVKDEFVADGDVAIASVNFHRNFFAERWNIRLDGGQLAFSGCVAFGMERWLHALVQVHGDQLGALTDAIEAGTRRAGLGAP